MRFKLLLAGVLAVLLAACQTVQSTDEAAVAYNRAFAEARDEITVLNVLRASERQPLQFSTMSSVQGAVRAGASIRVPFINVIAGDRDSISPEITVTARNPTVSITPLATREFIQGISRPLSPGVIDDLLVQGWPLPVVLGLTIGGVICEDGSAVLNSGVNPGDDERFQRAFRAVTDFGYHVEPPQGSTQLRMPAAEALRAAREGAGEPRRVVSVAPAPDGSGDALVTVVTPGEVSIRGIDFGEVCAAGKARRAPDDAELPAAEARHGGVLMRSVFGIFHYLGKAHAADLRRQLEDCRGDQSSVGEWTPLFHIEAACIGRGDPQRVVVATEFEGRRYYIRRAGDMPPEDRTLETLSLLTYLVDLQTSETAVKSSVPFIAITQP